MTIAILILVFSTGRVRVLAIGKRYVTAAYAWPLPPRVGDGREPVARAPLARPAQPPSSYG